MIYKLTKPLIHLPSRQFLPTNVNYLQKRNFFEWLVKIWNLVDKDRIEILGPERVTAEWLIRNGAAVRFKGDKDFTFDYHSFPEWTSPEEVLPMFPKKIEEIHAHDSSIHHHGFEHFKHCKHIKKIKFEICPWIKDKALDRLIILKDSLEHLELRSCVNITDKGLPYLVNLSNLKVLAIHNLPEVENKQEGEIVLRQGLKNCDITYEP